MRTCLFSLLLCFDFTKTQPTSFKSYKTLDEYSLNEKGEIPAQQIIMTDQATNYGAFCLDGSVPDFFYRPGFDDGIHKFHIYLQGGGWCGSITNCAERAGTDLGSSKFDANYSNIAAGAPYLSSQQYINPLAYNWNSILIRYCDGSSYASNNETIIKYNSTLLLYFRGFRILNGVLNTLLDKYGLLQATDVLFSGCSAGALGVYFHANHVYNWIDNIKDGQPFHYMAMPDAGYFMKQGSQGIFVTIMEFWYAFGNMTDGMDQNCREYYKKNNMENSLIECLYAANVAPFIDVKIFAMQSQYDPTQLSGIDVNDTVYINNYGLYLTDSFVENYTNTSTNKNVHYAWLVSCYQHCNFGLDTWINISIDSYDTSQAEVNAWFDNSTSGNLLFQNYSYPCDSCC
eukprot:482018_1